jgi:hypothetical protein
MKAGVPPAVVNSWMVLIKLKSYGPPLRLPTPIAESNAGAALRGRALVSPHPSHCRLPLPDQGRPTTVSRAECRDQQLHPFPQDGIFAVFGSEHARVRSMASISDADPRRRPGRTLRFVLPVTNCEAVFNKMPITYSFWAEYLQLF